MNILKKLFRKALIGFNFILVFIFFLIIADYFIKKILPLYDPSGRIDYIIEHGVPLIKKKNATFVQWKNTGDYSVSISSNEYGLRNTKKFTEVEKYAFYVVGDSHTFGHGVEENERYSDLLEIKYNLGEFVNIAIPSALTGYYNLLKYAEKNGGEINKIILGLSLENDIGIYKHIEKNNKIVSNNVNYFRGIKSFLRDTSSIYNLLTSVVHQNKIFRKIALKLKLINPYHKVNDYADEKEIASTVSYIKKIKSDFNPQEFYILLLPSRGLWFSENKHNYFTEHNSLKKLLEDNDISVIDPLPMFINANDPKKYYFKYDGHFNKLGHSLIASAVYNALS